MAVMAPVTRAGKIVAAHPGLLHNPIVAGRLGQIERAASHIVGRQHPSRRHLAAGLVGFDLSPSCLEPVGCMPQEDHPQHRHEVVAGGQLGIGA